MQAKSKNPLEREIEKTLVKKVKAAGGLCLKWTSSVTGVPDRLVFLNRRVHLVELKTATGKVSPRQIVMFQQLSTLGFPVWILRSTAEIERFLEQAPRLK